MSEIVSTKKTSFNQINAVKVLKEKVMVHYTETIHEMHFDKDQNLIKEDKYHVQHPLEGDWLPHEDFVVAMKMIRKLVIAICGWKGEFKNFDLYNVLGLTFKGMDENETAKVVITANKKIERSKQFFTFNTPPTTLFDINLFDDAEELDNLCKIVVDEAFKYILEGKKASPVQLNLEFESGENVTLNVQNSEAQLETSPSSEEDSSYMEPGSEV